MHDATCLGLAYTQELRGGGGGYHDDNDNDIDCKHLGGGA